MTEKFKNTKEVLHLVLLTASALEQAKKNDGKIDANDVGLLLPLLPAIVPAIQDANQIPKEFENIQSADGLALLQFVQSELNVSDEHAKVIINESLATLLQLFKLVQALKGKVPASMPSFQAGLEAQALKIQQQQAETEEKLASSEPSDSAPVADSEPQSEANA